MAKTNKNTPRPKTAASSPAREEIIFNDYLHREPREEANGPLLKKVFYGIAALAFVLMVGLSFGTGINADDKFQNDYSLKLVNYYTTMGKDSSALFIKDGNMHYYGGFFEIITGFVNKAAGNVPNDMAYHHVRHALSAVMGWLTLLLAGLLARYIAGWRAGIFTLVIMGLSARFVGESLMNPKDIPFACGYMMAVYFMTRVLDGMPRPNRWDVVGLIGGLAIAFGTRAGGLLPFAILGLFGGLHFLLKNGGLKSLLRMGAMGKYLLWLGGIFAGGYLLAILFWPYALQAPFKNPFTALNSFESLVIRIRVLFEGNNVRSDYTPWYYPAKWIYLTIPLATLAGFVGSILLAPRLLRRYQPLWYVLVIFSAVFPVFYVIYKDSVLHDGWRHLTFVYAPMAVAAGLFWNELVTFFEGKKAIQYATYGAMGLLLADSAWFIVQNPTIPYIYFNPIEGGVKNAFGQYETDYWGISVREGIQWLEEQKIISDTMTTQVVIATNMAYPAQKILAKYGDKVRVKYLKYELRCDDAWDYALYPSRTIGGLTLRKGFWPPDNAVHTIYKGGAPILSILKDNGRNCSLGTASLKVNDFENAIRYLTKEVQNVPDNEVAWSNLAQAYFYAGQQVGKVDPIAGDSLINVAKTTAEKALEIAPDDSQSNNLIGMYYLQREDNAKAKAQFELSAKLEPSNPGAFYYLALIALDKNDSNAGLTYLQKALDANPGFKPAIEMAIQVYEKTGNAVQAQKLRTYLQQLK